MGECDIWCRVPGGYAEGVASRWIEATPCGLFLYVYRATALWRLVGTGECSCGRVLFFVALDDDGGVVSAEAERIGEGGAHGTLASREAPLQLITLPRYQITGLIILR